MMARLIDAEKLNAVLQNQAEHLTENGDAILAACLIVCQETVERQPTIEAAPVVHGRWIELPSMAPEYQCSECEQSYEWWEPSEAHYCPSCGAVMECGE